MKLEPELYFGAFDGTTGQPQVPSITVGQAADFAMSEPVEPRRLRELRRWSERLNQDHFAPALGHDPANLAESGWGVIFPAEDDEVSRRGAAIRDALRPLLDLRRAQAGPLFKEYSGARGYRAPDETKEAFLARLGVMTGRVNPSRVPYHLLIVGDPETIPFAFQTDLDVEYSVGRIGFDHLEDYANYARSVVEAETRSTWRPPRVSFFGAWHPDDPGSRFVARNVLDPLASVFAEHMPEIPWDRATGEEATRTRLLSLLGGPKTPSLLVATAPGLVFPDDAGRSPTGQGAVFCQDWPGRIRRPFVPVPREQFVSADDIAGDASPFGLIALLIADYSAGTPQSGESVLHRLAHRLAGWVRVGQRTCLAALPRRLLAHPRGGALAIVGMVGGGWTLTTADFARDQTDGLQSVLMRLAAGLPVGAAVEPCNERYAVLTSELGNLLEYQKYGMPFEAQKVASLWAAMDQARRMIVVGDPAVRMVGVHLPPP
jgi:hypothetical protein